MKKQRYVQQSIQKMGIMSIILMMLLVVGCGNEATEHLSDGDGTVKETVGEDVQQENEVTETADDAHYPVTITTYNYSQEPVEITFEKAPEKVFAVYQDSIETLLALGLADRIVAAAGLDQEVKEEYQEGFDTINYMTEFSPDKENVIMLEPDFIVSWYSYFSDKRLGDVDYWHNSGVNTYMMLNSGAAKERDLENEYTDILNLGTVFNVEDKAQAIVDEMKNEIASILAETENLEERPSTLLMEVEKDGIRVYGDNTLGGDMVRQLGADLVTAPDNHMSSEVLIEENPDVIFTVYFGSSSSIADAQAAVEKLTLDPKYQSLTAVQEGHVYAISLGEIYCSGTRTLDGIKSLAAGIYTLEEQ